MPSYNSLDDPYCPLTQAKKFTDFASSTVSAERVGHSRQGRRSNQLDPIRKASTAPTSNILAQSLSSLDPRASTTSSLPRRRKKKLFSQTAGSIPSSTLEGESFDGAITISSGIEAGSHLDIVKKIMQREHMVQDVKALIAEIPPSEPSFGWMPKLESLLLTIRGITMEITEAISIWKIQQAGKQYMFNSENYLLKIRNDLVILDEHQAVSDCLGFPLNDNPFLAPTPYRGPPDPSMPVPSKLISSGGSDALRIRDCLRIVEAEVEKYGEAGEPVVYPQVSLSTLDGTGWTTLEPEQSMLDGKSTHMSSTFGDLNAHNNIMIEDCDIGDSEEPPGGWGEGVSTRYSAITEKHGSEYLAQAKKPVNMVDKLAARIQHMNGEIELTQENFYLLEKDYKETVSKQDEMKEKAAQVQNVLNQSGQGSAMQRSLSRLALKLSEWEAEIEGQEKQLKAQRCKLFFERQELERKQKVRETVEDKLEEEKEKVKRRQAKRTRIREKKQNLAATTIERHCRGYVCRKQIQHQKQKREDSAVFIQTWARRIMVRRALEKLGVSVSTHLGRKKELQRRVRAALIIQKYGRRMLASIKFKRLLRRRKRREAKGENSTIDNTDNESVSTQTTQAVPDTGSVKCQEIERSLWQTIGSQSIYYYINAANMNFLVGNMSDGDASMHMEAAQFEMEKSEMEKSACASCSSTLGTVGLLKDRPKRAANQSKADRISSLSVDTEIGGQLNEDFLQSTKTGDDLFSPGFESSLDDSEENGFDTSQESSLRASILSNRADVGFDTSNGLATTDKVVEKLATEFPDFNKSAMKIQAVVRGKAGRSFYLREKTLKTKAAVTLQAFYRGNLARLHQDRSKLPMKTFKELSVKETSSWMSSIGLSMYENAVLSAQIDGAWLTKADHCSLKEIGIVVRMHRVRVLREIDAARHALFAATVKRPKLRRRRRKRKPASPGSGNLKFEKIPEHEGADTAASSPSLSRTASARPLAEQQNTSASSSLEGTLDFSVETPTAGDELGIPTSPGSSTLQPELQSPSRSSTHNYVNKQPSDATSFQTDGSDLNIIDRESLDKLAEVKENQEVLEHKLAKLYGLLSGFNTAKEIVTPPETKRAPDSQEVVPSAHTFEGISEMYDQQLVCSAMVTQITDLAEARLQKKTEDTSLEQEVALEGRRPSRSSSKSVPALPRIEAKAPDYTFREEDYETEAEEEDDEEEENNENVSISDSEEDLDCPSASGSAESKNGSQKNDLVAGAESARSNESQDTAISSLGSSTSKEYIVKAEMGSILLNLRRVTHSSQGNRLDTGELGKSEKDTNNNNSAEGGESQNAVGKVDNVGSFFGPDALIQEDS